MNSHQDKICEVCRQPFRPDPRIGERQRVCKNLNCQRERKRRSQQNWVAKNPGYFESRYWYLKQWLESHPGYLKNYRAQRKQNSVQKPCDIQDELTSKNNKMITLLQIFDDIQDEISTNINNGKQRFKEIMALIYKSNEVLVFQ